MKYLFFSSPVRVKVSLEGSDISIIEKVILAADSMCINESHFCSVLLLTVIENGPSINPIRSR